MANPSNPIPIGERLRHHRVNQMDRSLRETAKLLDVTPAHLSDIETGNRSPSDELLIRIARVYDVSEADLRAGWGKAELDVARIASQSPTAAAKAPELLRAASNLPPEHWDELIEKAKSLAEKAKRRSKKKS